MSNVAIYTFGILREPYGNARVRGFESLLPPTFDTADRMEGFVARSKKPDPDRPALGQICGPWGECVAPKFYDGGSTPETYTLAATLSVWTALEHVQRFAYSGLHRTALAQRQKWFREPQWPSYVLWWVDDGQLPTFQRAARNLERLHDKGSTAEAFTFRQPFDAAGNPVTLAPMTSNHA
jgi:hypothetical protein